jgi:hypothetical protein
MSDSMFQRIPRLSAFFNMVLFDVVCHLSILIRTTSACNAIGPDSRCENPLARRHHVGHPCRVDCPAKLGLRGTLKGFKIT